MPSLCVHYLPQDDISYRPELGLQTHHKLLLLLRSAQHLLNELQGLRSAEKGNRHAVLDCGEERGCRQQWEHLQQEEGGCPSLSLQIANNKELCSNGFNNS